MSNHGNNEPTVAFHLEHAIDVHIEGTRVTGYDKFLTAKNVENLVLKDNDHQSKPRPDYVSAPASKVNWNRKRGVRRS